MQNPVSLSCSILMSATLLLTGAVQAADPDYQAIERAAGELSRLHSVLISQDGELVYERYYAGQGRYQPANMKSASKSVMSALVGIAIDKGYIESVKQPIVEYFPELNGDSMTANKRTITVEHLLTMQAGLETTSHRNYGRWVLNNDWVGFALNQPMVAEPGTDMIYSTGSTHLLSAILEKASGMSAREFASQYLMSPIGHRLGYWSRDPQGIYFGGNDMEMTPRAMLAFGELYLNEGRHNGSSVIPSQWISDSLQMHATSPRGQGRFYGYGWWLRDLSDMLVPVAWGYGGQLIFVIEAFETVVVVTSDSNPGPGRGMHMRQLYELVETHVIEPMQHGAAAGLTAGAR